MSNKSVITTIVVAIIVGAVGFFGGMKYGENKALTPAYLAGLSQTQRAQIMASARGTTTGGAAAGGAGRRGGAGGGFGGGAGGAGFTTGQILKQDSQSITIQLPNGQGSKTVYYSTSTQIQKTVAGQVSDLTTGQQVIVTGTANNDGSLTATTIQVRPPMPSPTATTTPTQNQ